MFRGTIAPKGGNVDNISHRAKDLLAQMAPGMPKFLVFEFIWNEIIHCSHDGSNGCHYAPYIFYMIKKMTGLEILTDMPHNSYSSPRGKIEQLLKIGAKATSRAPLGEFPGNYPPRGLHWSRTGGARQAQAPRTSHPPPPSSSHGPSHGLSEGPSSSRGTYKKKKGKLDFIAQGVFACFNMCKQNAAEICEHRRYMEEELVKIEKRQKELLAKNDIPHSPVREIRDFPPPPHIYNPWDDLSFSHFEGYGEEVEEDLGGREQSGRGL